MFHHHHFYLRCIVLPWGYYCVQQQRSEMRHMMSLDCFSGLRRENIVIIIIGHLFVLLTLAFEKFAWGWSDEATSSAGWHQMNYYVKYEQHWGLAPGSDLSDTYSSHGFYDFPYCNIVILFDFVHDIFYICPRPGRRWSLWVLFPLLKQQQS